MSKRSVSTVIKASGPVHGADAAPYCFLDMGDSAGGDLHTARASAAQILAKAEQDAAAIRKAAEEQGRGAALEAAEQILNEKVTRQLTTLTPALREAIDRVQSAKADWLAHWEKTAIHVAAAIAGRVIRRELKRAPDITLALVREALELAAGSGDIQLRMHPDDFKALGGQAQQLAAELARLGNAQVVADPRISKGGCRIETRFGSVDQQFEAQLARIEEELT
jgi:flagellar biosynthesis/type III secretory pathway protein FliH